MSKRPRRSPKSRSASMLPDPAAEAAPHGVGRLALDDFVAVPEDPAGSSGLEDAGAAFRAGNALKIVGRLEEAVQHYQSAIRADADMVEAHTELAALLKQLGKLDEAVASYRQALRIRPDAADVHNNLGNALKQLGRLDEALRCYEQALQLRPDIAEFHGNMGAALNDLGRPHDAVDRFQAALQVKWEYPEAHFNLGATLYQLGRLDAAIASLQQALKLRPAFPAAHLCLGNVFYEQNKLDLAVASFQNTLQFQKDCYEACFNLGNAWNALGNPQQAAACYQQAARLAPHRPEAFASLGNTCKQLGQLDYAARCYGEALQRDDMRADWHNNLGNIRLEQTAFAEAAACYERALQLQPRFLDARLNLANAYRDQGQFGPAREQFREAITMQPEQPLHRLRMLSLCPTVFSDRQQIAEYRAAFREQTRAVAELNPSVDVRQVLQQAPEPPFNLEFFDGSLREEREAYARIFRRLSGPPMDGRRRWMPRVGFVVTKKHEGIFLRSMRGILQRLDARDMELVVVCAGPRAPVIRQQLQRDDIRYLPLPEKFDDAARRIREGQFDVLYHWEVGTDATNYFLPMLRLAPVQCTGWGVQITSGMSQMDYYLSSRLVEADGADEHYTERLVRAATLLTWQDASPPPPRKTRSELQLPEGKTLYVCAQNLGKFHPDFDPLLAGILRNDAEGVVVVTSDRHGSWARVLKQRFGQTMPDVVDRIVFLPRLNDDDYRSLLTLADVLLDPPHFSGANSSYDALQLGKPIVTLPTEFRRGRFTIACYQKMQHSACIAHNSQQYVDIATRLGTDPGYRQMVGCELRQASDALLHDETAVAEFQRILCMLVEVARGHREPNRVV